MEPRTRQLVVRRHEGGCLARDRRRRQRGRRGELPRLGRRRGPGRGCGLPHRGCGDDLLRRPSRCRPGDGRRCRRARDGGWLDQRARDRDGGGGRFARGADGVSGRRDRRARAPREPMALARQMAPRDPALHRARAALDRGDGPDVRRRPRDPLHAPLPTRDLRLQRRRPSLDLARLVLLVLGERDGPLPAVLASGGAGLPRSPRGRLPPSS